MMNKLLLAAIAAGLWANAIVTVMRPARAQEADLGTIENYLANIESKLGSIESYAYNIRNNTNRIP